MGDMVRLRAKDGQELGAYVVQPGTPATSGLVIVQEIFGVNAYIRSVAERYADDGFVTIAPALFDRIEPDIEFGYDGADAQRAMELLKRFDMEKAVDDVGAAIAYLHGFGCKRVGVLGFCLGGTLAWLSAARLPVYAAVGYYGGRIAQYAAETPRAPVMLHFGDEDKHIPASEIDAIKKAHPNVQIRQYPAGHGFSCDARASYDASSATLARERTLTFLRTQLR